MRAQAGKIILSVAFCGIRAVTICRANHPQFRKKGSFCTAKAMVMNMRYLISGSTDVGIKRATNQDGLYVSRINASCGELAFACLCDGMGGLSEGEIASATVVYAFKEWVNNGLKYLTWEKELREAELRRIWSSMIADSNARLYAYGKAKGISLGTTLSAILLTPRTYYAVNIGDSRIYRIGADIRRMTKDHTFIQREIDAGRMTPEEAQMSGKTHILTRCIGVQERAEPDFYTGATERGCVYMLCSDGFRHKITSEEILDSYAPQKMKNEEILKETGERLIECNKQRRETDNISVAAVLVR